MPSCDIIKEDSNREAVDKGQRRTERNGVISKEDRLCLFKRDERCRGVHRKAGSLAADSRRRQQEKIQKQIKLAQYGLEGENKVAYELKTSGMDMYVLHDICLETGDLSAQIDYIVVTRKLVYVIECKNLYGNIEIDNGGNFVRQIGPSSPKEGIYSPITQNQRHLRVLKEIRKESKGNFLLKMVFEKFFEENHKSVVVLANPKTYLNAKYAPKEVKQQVIRADQLVDYIKKTDGGAKTDPKSEKAMLEVANFYLERHIQWHSDYAKQYEEMVARHKMTAADETEGKTIRQDTAEHETALQSQEAELVQKLKEFRLKQSRKENIKAYYIFNDAQMQELIAKRPQNREDLYAVAGFGKVKIEKYGDAILAILKGN